MLIIFLSSKESKENSDLIKEISLNDTHVSNSLILLGEEGCGSKQLKSNKKYLNKNLIFNFKKQV